MVDIQKRLKEANKDKEAAEWTGTLPEYLELAIANPELARSSHAYVHDMFQWSGVTQGSETSQKYGLFKSEIFGLDDSLSQIAQYFRAATLGAESRRRLLVLIGPAGSGKSTIVELIKSGLEDYSRTDGGAVFAIDGCPLQEQPLHLVLGDMRHEMTKDFGLSIEGELCPHCRNSLLKQYSGDISRVKIKRTALSQSLGVGIGSFVPSSIGEGNLSTVTGNADTSVLSYGQVEGANRGILEVNDLSEASDQAHQLLRDIVRGRVISRRGRGAVYVDQVVVACAREEDHRSSMDGPGRDVFREGAVVVIVPFSLRVRDELKIYQKLLPSTVQTHSGLPQGQAGVPPLALHLVATVAILSRLEGPARAGGLPGVSRLDKLRLYDGRVAPPYGREHVQELREKSPREGLFGLAPAFVANRLADAMSQETGCLTPARALKCLLDAQAGGDEVEWDQVVSRAREAIAEYKEMAIREVRLAGTDDYEEKAGRLFDSYVEQAGLAQDGQDQGADLETELDAKVLSRVEGALILRDVERAGFRRDVCDAVRHLQMSPDTPAPDHRTVLALEQAIEELLLISRDELKVTLDPKGKDPDRYYGREQINQRLIENRGHCSECAKDLVDFVWNTLQGKEMLKIKKRKLVQES